MEAQRKDLLILLNDLLPCSLGRSGFFSPIRLKAHKGATGTIGTYLPSLGTILNTMGSRGRTFRHSEILNTLW